MEEEELSELNELRQRALIGLQDLRSVLTKKDTNAETMSRALYGYIAELGIQEKLKARKEAFEAEGNLSLAKNMTRFTA